MKSTQSNTILSHPCLLQCAGFTALAIYLDAVLPDAMGVRRPPWFLLQPSYWLRGGSVSKQPHLSALPSENACLKHISTSACLTNLCDPPLPNTPTALPVRQRKSLRAAAAALAAPTEAESGLAVDPDVAEEAQRQRLRCAQHLRAAGAPYKDLPGGDEALPAELASTSADQPKQLAGKDVPSGETGTEVAPAGRPYAVEMFGLRKVYKVGT